MAGTVLSDVRITDSGLEGVTEEGDNVQLSVPVSRVLDLRENGIAYSKGEGMRRHEKVAQVDRIFLKVVVGEGSEDEFFHAGEFFESYHVYGMSYNVFSRRV